MGEVNMLFYDVEALPYYWCVVVVDDELGTRHVFEDVPSLRGYYKRNRKQTWVGYNSRQYDVPMLKFIMLGLDPYQCSQDLIVLGKKWFEFGYNVTEMYKRIPVRNFDCMLLNKGLKKLEGFRGSDIVECEIGWDHDKPLTREQKDKVVFYCTHDVKECRKIFYDTIQEYEAHEALVDEFNISDEHFSKSKAQLVALILNAQRNTWYDEWEYELVDTLQISRYTDVVEWYLDSANHDYKKKLEIDIAGVPHVFAWGGIHGAKAKYYGEGYYLNMDVESYYPALMIEYGFLSRTVSDPTIYRKIRDKRIVLKKNKDPKQQPYKIVLNGTFGAMKDRYNPLYDPRQANNVCINGQLLLLDLIEKLEDYCEIIQSNTDGVLVKLEHPNDHNKIVAIGEAWSERTRLKLEYEKVNKIFQKDVNNYLTVGEKGVKSKGAYAKTWLREDKDKNLVPDYTDYDLVILRKALHAYFVDGISVEETINNATNLLDFQKIVMVSRKYECGLHGDEELAERHLRVFASTNSAHKGIFKRHAIKKNLNKVSDTPVNAFIVNNNIEGKTTHDYPLDRSYYIKMAQKRIKAFGIK